MRPKEFFQRVARGGFAVHDARAAIAERAQVVLVLQQPARPPRSRKRFTVRPVLDRTADEHPARNERQHALDALDADLLFVDRPVHAARTFQIAFRVAPLVACAPRGKDESVGFVLAQRVDGKVQTFRRLADGVFWLVVFRFGSHT